MKFTFLLVNPDGESVNVTDTLELALVASSPKGPIFRRDDFARFSRSLSSRVFFDKIRKQPTFRPYANLPSSLRAEFQVQDARVFWK
jgi:hypothetical protein